MPRPGRGVWSVLKLAAALGAGLRPSPAQPAGPQPCIVEGTAVPADRLRRLSRGFNLTGWLDRKPAAPPNLAELKRLGERGFTHVRLPLKADYLSERLSTRAETDQQWRELARAVDRLLEAGYAVSLDMHPGDAIAALRRRAPEEAGAVLEALWRRLAGTYGQRAPERLFFEMLNEPATEADYALAVRLAGIVRTIAPHHTLILGPAHDQRIEALEALVPIGDPNVVYAFHFYDPMAFTHQGLDWSPPSDPLTQFRGVPFPSTPDSPAVRALRERLLREGRPDAAAELTDQMRAPWDAARIDRTFARAEAWSRSNRRPVIVNEFGVLSWHAPPADRSLWLRTVRRSAEGHCVGWTHWEYADAFGFMRREGGKETPDPAVLGALLSP